MNQGFTTLSHKNNAVAYAELYVAAGSTAQNIVTGATYTKLTGFATAGVSFNCTGDIANDKIIVLIPGVYRVMCALNFISDTDGVVYKCAAFVNGVVQNSCAFSRKLTTGAELVSASFGGFVTVTTANHEVDVRMAHDNGGTIAVTPVYMNLNAMRVA